MQPPVALSRSSAFSCRWRVKDRLVASLEPFIGDVARRVAGREGLRDAVVAAASAAPDLARHFDFDPSRPAGDFDFGLKPSILHREDDAVDDMTFWAGDRDVRLHLEMSDNCLRPIADLVERSARASFSADQLRADLPDDLHTLFDELLDCGFLSEAAESTATRPRWNAAAPGITRLQHASLLYRTGTTSVLVDPHFHSGLGGAATLTIDLADLGRVDAIVISHGHADHWYLPTLMLFPRDTPIIVPEAPGSTILCDDFVAVLRGLGFRHIVPLAWYAPPHVVGDLEIHALPFYGEQPLLTEQPRDPALRNWGNTYVVRSDGFTSWFLIDAGQDASGSMADVAQHVRSQFGPIDFLLSNLRPFCASTPFYITSGHYWLSLTADQMQRFPSMRDHCITLSPPGVAEVCRITQARHFLPYAHWWSALGARIEREDRLLTWLSDELARNRAGTRILDWTVGDQLHVRSAGSADVRPPDRA